MKKLSIIIVVAILISTLLTLSGIDYKKPLPVIIESILPACVFIEAIGEYDEMWSGSGVIVSDKVLTAAHILEDATELRIVTVDGNELEYLAIYVDPNNDFGYIDLADKAPSVDIIDSNSLRYGDEVIIIGAPFGYGNFPTVSYGIVSGIHRELNYFGDAFQIGSDAQTWPGNSGGGVFNRDGKLVGILVGSMCFNDGFSIITPTEVILDKIKTLRK